jgi:hypothetical protein
VLERVSRDLGVPLDERDISRDAEEERRWHDLVPVVLVDGREYAHWRVNETRLRRELTA